MTDRYQFPQPSRDDLGRRLMAAWLGIPADKLPAQMQAHTCDSTRRAWARVADAAVSQWQPIETAPRDGHDIQIWGTDGWTPEAHWCPQKSGWYQSYWDADWRTYSESAVYNPTHWMPLPLPPAENE